MNLSWTLKKPLRDLEKQLRALETVSRENRVDVQSEIDSILEKIELTQRTVYQNLTPWQKVQIARHPKRLYALDYIRALVEDFQELHGDRRFKDDPAMICGTGNLEGRPVMIIGQQKVPKDKAQNSTEFWDASIRKVIGRPFAAWKWPPNSACQSFH